MCYLSWSLLAHVFSITVATEARHADLTLGDLDRTTATGWIVVQ